MKVEIRIVTKETVDAKRLLEDIQDETGLRLQVYTIQHWQRMEVEDDGGELVEVDVVELKAELSQGWRKLSGEDG